MVIIVQVLGKYMIIRYLDPSGAERRARSWRTIELDFPFDSLVLGPISMMSLYNPIQTVFLPLNWALEASA